MKNPDISSLEHTSWRCQYHVVFVPKYRRMEIYREIRADISILVLEIGVSVEYHKAAFSL